MKQEDVRHLDRGRERLGPREVDHAGRNQHGRGGPRGRTPTG
jgi:hypothetical protein